MERIQPLARRTSAHTLRFSKVLPERLWIADQTAGTDKFTLQHLSITHVVCIGQVRYHEFCPNPPPISHTRYIVSEDLNSLSLAVFDNIITSIRKSLSEGPSSRVLVHCESGINLGATIAIACLMGAEGLTFEKAQEELQRRTTVSLRPMLPRIIAQWWDLETSRLFFPVGRGYRRIEWEVGRAENSYPAKYPFDC